MAVKLLKRRYVTSALGLFMCVAIFALTLEYKSDLPTYNFSSKTVLSTFTNMEEPSAYAIKQGPSVLGDPAALTFNIKDTFLEDDSSVNLDKDGHIPKLPLLRQLQSRNNVKLAPQGKAASIQLSTFNQTRIFQYAHESERVFYNRVPKCGSEGVVNIIRMAAKLNGFNVNRSHEFHNRYLGYTEQVNLLTQVESLEPPFFFDRHVYFLNFSSFSREMPVYINVVRDPVERFMSAFYYNKKFCKSKSCIRETIEQCLLSDSYKCNISKTTNTKNRMWMIIPFFCGHHEICRLPNRAALLQAMKTIEQHYLVVGVLENLESFYYVLDKAMPKLFSGIHKIYLEMKAKEEDVQHSTSHKPSTSVNARVKIREQLYLEYELYEFIKQQLYIRLLYIHRSTT